MLLVAGLDAVDVRHVLAEMLLKVLPSHAGLTLGAAKACSAEMLPVACLDAVDRDVLPEMQSHAVLSHAGWTSVAAKA